MALFRGLDSPGARAAVVAAWGAEVLQRYGWEPRDGEFVCGGCGARGGACEIFATGRPFHPPGSRGSLRCPLQSWRRRVYRQEWDRFVDEISELCGLPKVISRLVWGFVPSFGLVLGWGHLLGPLPGRVGDHSRCKLCTHRGEWQPELSACVRLGSLISQCQLVNAAEVSFILKLALFRDIWHPLYCGCGRPASTVLGRVEVCGECSGRGAGLQCRCSRRLQMSCRHCRKTGRPGAARLRW